MPFRTADKIRNRRTNGSAPPDQQNTAVTKDGNIDWGSGGAPAAALIAAVQALEHYEIFRHSTLRDPAKVLGCTAAQSLTGFWAIEKAGSVSLTSLARKVVKTMKYRVLRRAGWDSLAVGRAPRSDWPRDD